MAATALAFLAYLTKQPLLLAYLATGAAIGPQFGFGWVSSQDDIKIIAEIGLILLLFMIGLELNLKKFKESGESLITTGIFQFILCAAMGLGLLHAAGVHHAATPVRVRDPRGQGRGRPLRPLLSGHVSGAEQHYYRG